ncbi:hypothetical protein FHU37_000441 [Allostreptomyces psammosilenae]|uniref:Uncharacterized protein n=1 Tax=Allostreptomyces psammosilenae TaxID=1892865 RepID=A0A852ZZE9_9ACTN|nr:hypothetical protein [Allostreptomyces psammosilenae]
MINERIPPRRGGMQQRRGTTPLIAAGAPRDFPHALDLGAYDFAMEVAAAELDHLRQELRRLSNAG